MFKLVTVFRTSLGKRQTWSLNNPDSNKSAVEVKDLLQRLTKVKLALIYSTRLKARNMSKLPRSLFFRETIWRRCDALALLH